MIEKFSSHPFSFETLPFDLKNFFMDQILKDVEVGNEEKRIDKFLLFTCFFIESENYDEGEGEPKEERKARSDEAS